MVSERRLNNAKMANNPKPAAMVNSTLDRMESTPKVITLNNAAVNVISLFRYRGQNKANNKIPAAARLSKKRNTSDATSTSNISKPYYFFCGLMGVFKNRSEEHTSELQSRGHLVCRLLLEIKKIDKE